MGYMPNVNDSFKMDTIKKYITLIGDLVGNVGLKQAKPEQGKLGTCTTTSLILDPTASSSDGFYVGYKINVEISKGIIEKRKIISYVGATKTAVVNDAFSVVPSGKLYAINVLETFKPMVRLENSNKTMFRKMYDFANANREIKTNNDIYRFPLITYKLSGMNIDTERLSISNFRLDGEYKDETGELKALTQYIKSPIPYDFTFEITMWSNLYSHLLDFIENFTPQFYLTNTFRVTTLESPDNSLRLLHDTVIYLNSVGIPQPLDVIDATTNEPIQSMTVSLVLKGFMVPPIRKANVIKTIEAHFKIKVNEDEPYTEFAHITIPTP